MAELQAHQLVVDRHAPGARASTRAVDAVDLAIHRGELVAVMGGTGAGKSTLALALCGLVPLVSGRVDGDGAAAARLVLQRPESTFLADRVLDEVMLAPRAQDIPADQAAGLARHALAQLGLPGDIAGRDPLALSGGEQRRVAIAGVIAATPRVLVLDEPGAGLDRVARHALHDAIRDVHAGGCTIVLVTHDADEALALATRLVVLQEGRVAWDGPPALVLTDPVRARALGVEVPVEVDLLHRVAAARGAEQLHSPSSVAAALDQLVELAPERASDPRQASPLQSTPAAPPLPAAAPRAHRPPLAELVDARARLLATTLGVLAALLAGSLAAAAAVALVAASAVALARIDRARVRLAVRPLVALAVLLVALQYLLGSREPTPVFGERVTDWTAAPAVLRALQASAVVLVTLVLSASTTTVDLAVGLRRVLAPLAVLRVPVASLAFVVATGIGLVPSFADELERLRLAQRARGIRPLTGGRIAGLRADTQLLAPLFVAAFRRAHLLADALAVRGIDPRAPLPDWRSRRIPRGDLLLVVVAAGLVAMTRFA